MGEPQVARHQWQRLGHEQIVLVVAVLVGHFERVAKPFGRDESDLCATPLDHRIGRKRRPVHDHCDFRSREFRLLQKLTNAQ